MTRAEREALHADLDDAERRAEAAELGCEIAYRREPTQAEGDAHEYRHDQSMGASECIGECHVPMGNHHGHRCRCGLWVWGGPTTCQRCTDAESVKIVLEWKARALDAEAERDRLRGELADVLAERDGMQAVATQASRELGRAVEAWRELPEDTRRYTLVALLESQRYAQTHGWLHESIGLSAAAALLSAAGGGHG